MASSEREQRLKFLGLTQRDGQLLKALRPLFERHVVAIEDAFYDHLLSFPETARLLRDRSTVDRLKQLQRDYLIRITGGVYDDGYFEERVGIGRAHERVGLSPHWYLLAYSHYFRLISPLIRQHYAADRQHADDSILALEKVFMLDASLAMDAYIENDRFRHLRQLESIVNDSADVIFALDIEQRFRSWNRAAERIFGWRAEEIVGKPLTVLLPPELVKNGEVERIDEQMEREGYYHFETVRLARDGRRVPVEVTVSVLRDAQGNMIGRSAILRDITERKQMEEEKLRAERLAVIGAMSARLAHEIRNPLSSIALNIELVRDEIESLARDKADAAEESRSLLRSIDSEMRRIQRVTEDYLQFARMPKPQRELISLNDVLSRELSFLQPLFEATGIEVRTRFDESLPSIHADEDQIWQAILNLIRNAIEAMPKGGALTLTTARSASGAVLTVGDSGKGMTSQEQEQIFKPFFSTKSERHRVGFAADATDCGRARRSHPLREPARPGHDIHH